MSTVKWCLKTGAFSLSNLGVKKSYERKKRWLFYLYYTKCVNNTLPHSNPDPVFFSLDPNAVIYPE
jgi:hypothetical protein